MTNKKTIKQLLTQGTLALQKANVGTPRLDAEVLLDSVLHCGRITFYSHPDRLIDEALGMEYANRIARRGKFEPVAYIIGEKEFMGLSFFVTPDVLIPRPDTEAIVEKIIEKIGPDLRDDTNPLRILDLCTGSGAIGLSLKKNMDYATVTLSDISEAALKIARKNAERLKIDDIKFIESDLYQGFKDGTQFDLIVSNPPYIPDDVIGGLQKDVVDYEPHLALSGGISGYQVYERIARESAFWLSEKGIIVLEVGHDQADHVLALFEAQGFLTEMKIKDLTGTERGVVVRRII